MVLSTVFSGVLGQGVLRQVLCRKCTGVREAWWESAFPAQAPPAHIQSSGAGPAPQSEEHTVSTLSQSLQAGLTHTPKEGKQSEEVVLCRAPEHTLHTHLKLSLHLENRPNLA